MLMELQDKDGGWRVERTQDENGSATNGATLSSFTVATLSSQLSRFNQLNRSSQTIYGLICQLKGNNQRQAKILSYDSVSQWVFLQCLCYHPYQVGPCTLPCSEGLKLDMFFLRQSNQISLPRRICLHGTNERSTTVAHAASISASRLHSKTKHS